jgi:hypothetical protein
MADEKLPSYFPLKIRRCAIVADTFFTCFEANATPVGHNSIISGRKYGSRGSQDLCATNEVISRVYGYILQTNLKSGGLQGQKLVEMARISMKIKYFRNHNHN